MRGCGTRQQVTCRDRRASSNVAERWRAVVPVVKHLDAPHTESQPLNLEPAIGTTPQPHHTAVPGSGRLSSPSPRAHSKHTQHSLVILRYLHCPGNATASHTSATLDAGSSLCTRRSSASSLVLMGSLLPRGGTPGASCKVCVVPQLGRQGDCWSGCPRIRFGCRGSATNAGSAGPR